MVGYAPRGPLLGGAPPPQLGQQPTLGGWQPSLDFLTQIPGAIQQATGWTPGTTPQWVPDWLRNLSASNTAQQQATQQNLAALPPRYAMTPQDINTAMSLGMNADILAYHGSPYTFDAFDASKIGTGEGAQAYGHGLYFAENPGIAEHYRDTLAARSEPTFNWTSGRTMPASDAANWMARNLNLPTSFAGWRILRDVAAGRSWDEVRASSPAKWQPAIDWMEKNGVSLNAPRSQGFLYKVDIQPDPEQFLDWDKPLSEQSPHVQQAVKQTIISQKPWLDEETAISPKATGQDIYHSLGFKNPADTAEAWRQAGIPGIRYLDQGSRPNASYLNDLQGRITKLQGLIDNPPDWWIKGQPDWKQDLTRQLSGLQDEMAVANQGTHNYVVFDPAHVKILERNNQPIGPMLGAQPQLGK